MRQHDQRHVVMPSAPTPALIMIKSEFLLQLLVVLLDLPSRFGDLNQSTETVLGGQIAKEVFGRLRSFDGPLDQQPKLFTRLTTFMKSVRGLHTPRPETALQPTFAAFPPANFLPALRLLSGFPD